MIKKYHQQQKSLSSQATNPISSSILWLPKEHISTDVVYLQKATNTRIEGYYNLNSACIDFEKYFQSEEYDDVNLNLCRVQPTSPTTVIVQWNVTWTNPTSTALLESLAKLNNWTPNYRTYIHLSDQVSKFSYKAVFDVFYEAFTTQQIRIPLACIEGTSVLEFTNGDGDNEKKIQLLKSISEDIGLAQDLQQSPCTLRNRKCAQDLRLFLETARRINDPTKDNSHWDDTVATKLPWTSVPGMGALDIEESDDDPIVPILFLGFSVFVIVGFAAMAAPELIGQSLFGPPKYIVPPGELNSIY